MVWLNKGSVKTGSLSIRALPSSPDARDFCSWAHQAPGLRSVTPGEAIWMKAEGRTNRCLPGVDFSGVTNTSLARGEKRKEPWTRKTRKARGCLLFSLWGETGSGLTPGHLSSVWGHAGSDRSRPVTSADPAASSYPSPFSHQRSEQLHPESCLAQTSDLEVIQKALSKGTNLMLPHLIIVFLISHYILYVWKYITNT